MKKSIVVFIGLILLLWAGAVNASQFQITDLGTLGGGSSSIAINDLGQVLGESVISTDLHSFLYENGTMTDLGQLGISKGINNYGQVVGFFVSTTFLHAYLYENGTMTDLGTLGGNTSIAYGINDIGQVVGVMER